MDNQRKTSNILINSSFQFRFMRMIFGLLLVTYSSVIIVAYWIYGQVFDKLLEMDLPLEAQDLITNIREIDIFIAALLFGALACFFLAASLLISHKIAGPLYNLESKIEEMIESGQLKNIKFRKGDFFPSLEQKFNELVSKIKN